MDRYPYNSTLYYLGLRVHLRILGTYFTHRVSACHYALPSPRRTTFLLSPKESDSRISQKSKEKLDALSLKHKKIGYCISPVSFHVFVFLFHMQEMELYAILSYYHLNISIMPIMSPSFGFSTFGTISAVHFHHLSTHVRCVTCVHVIGGFCHLTFRFTAPDTRCLQKTCKFRLSRNSTKFDVLARFHEMIPTVKSVSSSEI